MLFNSLGFILFLAIVLLVYYQKWINWTSKKTFLLFASYVFYGLWNPPLILLLWISTMVDWQAGKKLAVESNNSKRKLWLLASMCVNLGFLGFFKYGNFLLENFVALCALGGVTYSPPAMDIILPMGISFYTFQTMSYTIDMYHRKIERAKTFLDFALYVTFFPQLVAGPIVRAKDLITQFYAEKKASLNDFIWGSFLLSIGLFQKVVMADTLLADTADSVFSAKGVVHGVDAWAGLLAFSGQIFFDFAGYSTCAIGIALMLGIVLPDNFRYPYAAVGFSDFWKRWHISLSTWLRDYLYIPLGGNRNGIIKMYVALMITMLLGGLWHGAAWTFVAWGALHGFYLIAERVIRTRLHFPDHKLLQLFAALLTFFLVSITWVFFRAESFSEAMKILTSLFTFPADGEQLFRDFRLIQVFGIGFLLFTAHWLMRNSSLKAIFTKMNSILFGILWAILLFLIAIAQGSGEQFIYFQF